MGGSSDTARRHGDLARIGLGIGDELGNCLGWNRWMHHYDVRLAVNACDRCDVADEIETELVIERCVDGVPPADDEQRVAVRRTTASVSILPPPPGRFSTTNCWPSRSDSH